QARAPCFDLGLFDEAGAPVARLTALSVRAVEPKVQGAAAFFRSTWSADDRLVQAADLSGSCLLLTDRPTQRDELTAALCAAGAPPATVVLARRAESFARRDAQTYDINPEKPEEFAQLIHSLEEDGLLPSNIVHMWDAGLDPKDARPAAQIERGIHSLFHLTKVLLAHRGSDRVRLVTVGRTRTDLSLPQAAIGAFG